MPITCRTFIFCITSGVFITTSTAWGASFTTGDVFASIGNGAVNWYRGDGTFVQMLNTGQGGTTVGSAFDSSGNFYVTDFSVGSVSKFDINGNPVSVPGSLGGPYNAMPDSILFDAAGNAFVADEGGNHQVLEFDSAGVLKDVLPLATTANLNDSIDLAADQRTLYYTQGHAIRRFDIAANAQLSDLTDALPFLAGALRILGDGSVLVADGESVLRLDGAGNVIQTYQPAGSSGQLFALNFDADGKSFWTGDVATGSLYKVDVATGAIEESINTGAVNLRGVSVFGAISPTATPEPAQLGLALLLCGVLAVVHRCRKHMAAQ